MKKILSEIQSGQFAREWVLENQAHRAGFRLLRFFFFDDFAPRLAAAGLPAAFAGSTAIASISNSAPGRASCEIATVVEAGGAAMLRNSSRTSRKIPICDMSTR